MRLCCVMPQPRNSENPNFVQKFHAFVPASGHAVKLGESGWACVYWLANTGLSSALWAHTAVGTSWRPCVAGGRQTSDQQTRRIYSVSNTDWVDENRLGNVSPVYVGGSEEGG